MATDTSNWPTHSRAAFDAGRELERQHQETVRRMVKAEQDVKQVFQWLAGKRLKRQTRGLTLRAVVGDIFAVGSTTAHEMCERHGLDPNMRIEGV